MICFSILLLISVFIDCRDWCPYVKPNGTYSGLRIYHRYNSTGEEVTDHYVMFNSAGDEWRFDLGYNQNDKYVINMLDNTVKHTGDEGVLHRFGVLTIIELRPELAIEYWDCSVSSLQNKVKFDFCFIL